MFDLMPLHWRNKILGLLLFLLGLSLVGALPVMADGNIIYVDIAAPGPVHNGLSWTTAYTNVQAALTVALPGYEIWVARGVYTPTARTTPADPRTATFDLKNGVAIYGGFAATETLLTQRDWTANVTILSGDLDGNDANADANHIAETWKDLVGANAYRVVTSDDVAENTRLDGFTISAGNANDNSYGGGMGNFSNSNPTLANVTFSGNQAWHGGGMYNSYNHPVLIHVIFSGNASNGMYNDNSSPSLTDVIFSDNSTGMYNTSSSNPILTHVTFHRNGGGMYNSQSNPTLSNVTFSDNRSGGMSNHQSHPVLTNVTFSDNRNGGMYNSDSNPVLTNVAFRGNQAEQGGGMVNHQSQPTLTNVIFSGNLAVNGGGMANSGSQPILVNVTFSSNWAYEQGGGMYNRQSAPTLINSLLWGNQALSGTQLYNDASVPTITYSNIEWPNGVYTGTGNINADPLFRDPVPVTQAPTTTGDYRLSCGSPAIDAGNPLSVTTLTDLDGLPRIAGTTVDMGAYETPLTDTVVCLALHKTVTPLRALPGDTLTYTLAFANHAAAHLTATQVLITDVMPLNLGVQSVISSGVRITATGAAPAYAWQVSDLAPGQGGTITLTAILSTTLPRPTTLSNTASITSATVDAPFDNISTASVHLPGVLYVNTAAAGPTHDGLSWTTAYTTLQDALTDAQSGDEIWVAQGVYTPTARATSADPRSAAFPLKNGVAIYGGFAATETLRTQRDWAANVTILSGDIDGNDINTDTNHIAETWVDIVGNNVYHVVTGNHVTETARLDGFTITAGSANGYDDSVFCPWGCGGGMYNRYSSPTLVHLTFSGNQTTRESGGGIYNTLYSHPTLMDVTFSGNQADHCGGGMSNASYSHPSLINVTFNHNQAGNGGGMFNNKSSPLLTNVIFNSNHAGADGGGMYNTDHSSPILIGVVFSENQTGDNWGEGGGMYNNNYSSPVLTDVVFNGNQTGRAGGGMYNADHSNPELTNVTFSNNRSSDDWGGGGGGMYNTGSNPTLTHVTFTNNRAEYSDGGGMHNSSSHPILINVTFSGNQAFTGGGMTNLSSRPTLTNVVFSGNQAGYGGGMNNHGGYPTLTNVTFSGNWAAEQGGGMANDGSRPTLVNCILWGNQASTGAQLYNDAASVPTITYSNIEWPGGVYTGTGNLNTDPLFRAPIPATQAPTTAGDYRLNCGSPAMDTGNPLSVTTLTDLDGLPRITGATVDMGAYEDPLAYTGACLSLHKYVTPASAFPGAILTYTLAFTNHTTARLTATQVLITDVMPLSLTVQSIVSSGAHITATGAAPAYTWQVSDLAPGQGGIITLTAILSTSLPRPTTLSNTAIITSATADALFDNASTASVHLPGILYVNAAAPGPTHNGLSWTTAYTTLQDALTDAQSGDEIWVAQGVYTPTARATSADPRSAAFTLKNDVALYGGFAATETLRTQRDWAAHVTVLSGDLDGNDVTTPVGVVTRTTAITGNNAYHVVTGSNVTETARLDGFTLTAGNADNEHDYSVFCTSGCGGGVHNSYNSRPTLANLVFSGNRAEWGGGVINFYHSRPTLINVIFSNNEATEGGGMGNYESDPTLTDITFSGNYATYGGGIDNSSSSPILTNVTFSGNYATYGGGIDNSSSCPTLTNVTFRGNQATDGGGIYNSSHSNPTLTNVTFSGNYAGNYGGGLANYYDSQPTLVNVTLSGNRATYGGGMANSYNSCPTLVNCILWGNQAITGAQIYNNNSILTINYSDIQWLGLWTKFNLKRK